MRRPGTVAGSPAAEAAALNAGRPARKPHWMGSTGRAGFFDP